MLNLYVKRDSTPDVINIIPSFNPMELFIVYSPGYDDTSKQFINIPGCNSFKYHLHNWTGLSKIIQTVYVWRIIYTIKPIGLCVLLFTVWYQRQESRILGWTGKPVFCYEKDNQFLKRTRMLNTPLTTYDLLLSAIGFIRVRG